MGERGRDGGWRGIIVRRGERGVKRGGGGVT